MTGFFVSGVGLFTPGFASLDAYLRGERDPELVAPPFALATGRRKRGTSRFAQMMGEAFVQAVRDANREPDQVATVFTSSWGEIDVMVELLGQMVGGAASLSPMRFKNSVHNASSGLVSIAAANQRFSTALAAGDQSFEAGVVEAATLLATTDEDAVVVVVGDDRLPEPLDAFDRYEGLALAVCLEQTGGDAASRGRGHLDRLRRADVPLESVAPDVPEAYRRNCAAWALQLVTGLGSGGTLRLSGAPRPWLVDTASSRDSHHC